MKYKLKTKAPYQNKNFESISVAGKVCRLNPNRRAKVVGHSLRLDADDETDPVKDGATILMPIAQTGGNWP